MSVNEDIHELMKECELKANKSNHIIFRLLTYVMTYKEIFTSSFDPSTTTIILFALFIPVSNSNHQNRG